MILFLTCDQLKKQASAAFLIERERERDGYRVLLSGAAAQPGDDGGQGRSQDFDMPWAEILLAPSYS